MIGNMVEKRSFESLTEETFSELYQVLWKKLYCVGYSHVRDKTLAQELVQDVFVKLWLNRNDISKVENAEAYLLRALRNKVYDHFDSVTCRKKHHDIALEHFVDRRDDVNDIIVFNEGMSIVNEELRKMPEKTRTVFQMSKFYKYTNDEIAVKMQLSSKAVEYHITQALKRVRTRLAIFLS